MTEDNLKDIKSAVATISYGLYVVGSAHEGKINGQTCNTVFQITSEPVQIAIGINHRNLTHDLINASGIFSVSVLANDGHDLVRKFGYRSGRTAEKYDGIPYFAGVTGAPILEDCLAYLECRVQKELCLNCGTHTLFVAQVEAGGLKRAGEPMTYAYFTATKSAKKPAPAE
ncbi:MAG TPA: flavin reductase family protein [Spirochaetia bacterium]|nr:flavin reductase family protein [Spirochaetia bacterium]